MQIRIVKRSQPDGKQPGHVNDVKTPAPELREDWLKESRASLQMKRANDLVLFGYSEKLHAVYSAKGHLTSK